MGHNAASHTTFQPAARAKLHLKFSPQIVASVKCCRGGDIVRYVYLDIHSLATVNVTKRRRLSVPFPSLLQQSKYLDTLFLFLTSQSRENIRDVG